jgi:hypothetical protein
MGARRTADIKAELKELLRHEVLDTRVLATANSWEIAWQVVLEVRK